MCCQSLWKLRIRAVLPVFAGRNEIEGRLVSGIKILPADNLEKLCAYLNGDEKRYIEKNREGPPHKEIFSKIKKRIFQTYVVKMR